MLLASLLSLFAQLPLLYRPACLGVKLLLYQLAIRKHSQVHRPIWLSSQVTLGLWQVDGWGYDSTLQSLILWPGISHCSDCCPVTKKLFWQWECRATSSVGIKRDLESSLTTWAFTQTTPAGSMWRSVTSSAVGLWLYLQYQLWIPSCEWVSHPSRKWLVTSIMVMPPIHPAGTIQDASC